MARSLFSQLQEILSEMWVVMEQRREQAIPTARILTALEATEDYPSDDPEHFDEVVATVRASLDSKDLQTLHQSLQELAELSRAGATSYV